MTQDFTPEDVVRVAKGLTGPQQRQPDPVLSVIDDLFSRETDSMRWLRERSDRIAKAYAETMAENAAEGNRP